jgi:hypothetical protein
MINLEDYNVYLEVYTWSFIMKHLHLIQKSILNYQKEDSIESKVDGKPLFAMLLITPYMAQFKFFPNFY